MNRVLRKGFTIVEMLMVLGIIAVLLGLVTSASMAAIRHARDHKASACLQVIQSGIATYRAQKGKWPKKIQELYENGLSNNQHTYTLAPEEYDEVLKEVIVEESLKSTSPMLDPTGLIVATKGSNGSWGVEFREAVKKQKRHGGKVKTSNMAFGYQNSSGRFARFKIIYNADSDHVTVTK